MKPRKIVCKIDKETGQYAAYWNRSYGPIVFADTKEEVLIKFKEAQKIFMNSFIETNWQLIKNAIR